MAGKTKTEHFQMTTGGNAGYVLTSDPDGNASWLAPALSAVDNDWTVSGPNMYSTVSGNVGIGTSTPTAKLEVTEDILINHITVGKGNALGLGNVANFASSFYWSSTEINWEYVWGMEFAMNAQATNHKIVTGHVRAVRSF